MKQVRVKNIPGFKTGEVRNLPDNAALTYCRNGQGEPFGWSLEEEEVQQPVNRMLDTRTSAKTRKKSDAEETE